MADPKTPEAKSAVPPSVDAKELVKELMPYLAALAQMKAPEPERPRVHVQAPVNRRICHVCRQDADTGCGGEHEEMVVFPTRYPEHGKFFRGVILNGVTYLSNNESHKVLVPARAVPTIQQIVIAYEDNEQATRIGRRAERHSGSIGNSGTGFNPANSAWR